jgi:hypothetical protein
VTRKRRSLALGTTGHAPPPNCAATGKRCYRSERVARQAHVKASFRVRVFRCASCAHYHVTHETKGERA